MVAGNSAEELILIVDDEPIIVRALVGLLEREGYRAETVTNAGQVTRRLDRAPPSLVLLDLKLPDGHGLDLLPDLRSRWPDAPVIVMTGHGSVETAVRALRMGAFNYVQKPFNPDELMRAVRQALETARLQQRVDAERRRNEDRFSFDRIVATSPAMARVIEQAQIVAASPASTILLLGESGTGKGVLANSIHHASARSRHPLMKVTCSAIPETLLEAEMFGHERGAFTDAKQLRRGVFEAADGGTVVLDEIGDMPLALQAKLLGVIEDRAFSRIGGTERVAVDVRLVAATHRDLERAVEHGRFRADVLYRLGVVPIVLPALRDRIEDILPLAEVFLEEFRRKFEREVEGLDETAQRYLKEHGWPGNTRELRNVIERAMLFAKGAVLTADDLMIDTGYRPRATAGAPRGFILPPDGVALDEVEQELVRQAMRRSGNNQSRAAALLHISRDQIRYRLDKMGLLPRKREV